MANLLDNQPSGGLMEFLANDPGSRLGINLLAAGSPRYGRGIAQAFAAQDQQRQQAMQNKLLESQIAENAIQNRQREMQMQNAMAQQARENAYFFGGSTPTASAATGSPGQGGTNSAMSSGGGGSVPSEGKFDEWSRLYNIPKDVLMADYFKNNGKKLSELLDSRTKPNWVNINGNLVNTNAQGFQGGIQDQVQLGPDGRATILRANGGNPVMGAVPGSFDTYSAFKDIDNRTSAQYSPGRPVIGPDGRQYGQSQLSEIGAASPRPLLNPPGMSGRNGPTNNAERGMAEQIAQVPYDVQKEIASVERELRGGGLNPTDRAQATAYLQTLRSQGATPASPGSSAAGALDFSPTEKAAQEAARTRAVDTAKADVTRDSDNRTKVRSATENLTNADRAIELLRLGPTGSAVGSLIDKGAALVGMATPGGNIAAQLDIVSANMVKNVPRFEGPQSNIDVEGYKAAAGRVADRSLPIAQRIAAANEVKYFEEKAIRQAGGNQSSQAGNGATGSWDEKPSRSSATMRFNPQTGRLEKVS